MGLGFLMTIMLTGCTSATTPTPTASPTLSPTPQIATLPPTWTPGTPGTPLPPTETPTSVLQLTLNAAALSLPPTWTSVPVVTDTPLPQVTSTTDTFSLTVTAYIPPTAPPTAYQPPLRVATAIGTGQPPQSSVAFPPDCPKFQLKTSLSRFSIGQEASLAWQPISSATLYHLWVETPDGIYDYNVTATGGQLTVPAKIFVVSGLYGWELVAYDGDSPICSHLAGVFAVSS